MCDFLEEGRSTKDGYEAPKGSKGSRKTPEALRGQRPGSGSDSPFPFLDGFPDIASL